MLIQRDVYLGLLARVRQLENDNHILGCENEMLASELERQKCANQQLMHRVGDIREESRGLKARVLHQNEVNHCDIKGYLAQLDHKQKKHLDSHFERLETSALQKYKVLQIRNTNNRIENHELVEFVEKVKKMYRKAVSEQDEPSLKDLVKWVRSVLHQKGEGSGQGKKESSTGTSWKQSRVR